MGGRGQGLWWGAWKKTTKRPTSLIFLPKLPGLLLRLILAARACFSSFPASCVLHPVQLFFQPVQLLSAQPTPPAGLDMFLPLPSLLSWRQAKQQNPPEATGYFSRVTAWGVSFSSTSGTSSDSSDSCLIVKSSTGMDKGSRAERMLVSPGSAQAYEGTGDLSE